MKIALLAGMLAAAMALMTPAPVQCANCGIVPIKPFIPIGCKDLRAKCVCNAAGEKCEWSWECVK